MIRSSGEPLITKYMFMKASKEKIPLSGAFELSPVCNMDCRMCYVRMSSSEMKSKGRERAIEEWIAIGKAARDKGMLYLLLTGGEPFLYKDFKILYTELKKLGLMISINSNGTLIDEEVIAWLSKNPPHRINITLYGASNKTYNRLCGNPKGFNKVTKAIRLLQEAGISVNINASMTPYNIDDMKEIYKFGEDKNIHVRATSYMFPPIRKDENLIGFNNRFSSEEAGVNTVKQDLLGLSREDFKVKAENMRRGIVAHDGRDDDCKTIEGDKILCRAGRSSFWINWKGQMTPCGMMNYPYENVFDIGFEEAWNRTVESTRKIHTSIECAGCKNKNTCSICAAMAVTETGDFDKKPEYICKMTETILSETERVYQKMLLEEKDIKSQGEDSRKSAIGQAESI